ncbi:MAG: hypothetical protein KDD41_01430 [Flavobacteriales bacterium]|nr:hypothetical protein [Flavobacteriales bacterium]
MKNERIRIEKEHEALKINIRAFFDPRKQQLLMLWIVLFSICGIAIISQFFGNYERGVKLFFVVYLVFWFFFEFKVVYAFRWRKYGLEELIVEKDTFTLVKSIGKRGITTSYRLEDIKKIDFYKDANGKFVKSMNTSYWNINRYSLALYLEKETVPFAIDIESSEAKSILHQLRTAIKELQ